jgi:hypothetical protein
MIQNILYVGKDGNDFEIIEKSINCANRLVAEGKAVKLPESIWEVDHSMRESLALAIRQAKLGY